MRDADSGDFVRGMFQTPGTGVEFDWVGVSGGLNKRACNPWTLGCDPKKRVQRFINALNAGCRFWKSMRRGW
jgi:hypothetical protein